MDTTRLYIGQLLNKYRQPFSSEMYTVNYRLDNAKQDSYRMFGHDEGIDFAITYIRELENKIDELQYVEKIIKLAKAEETHDTCNITKLPCCYCQPVCGSRKEI